MRIVASYDLEDFVFEKLIGTGLDGVLVIKASVQQCRPQACLFAQFTSGGLDDRLAPADFAPREAPKSEVGMLATLLQKVFWLPFSPGNHENHSALGLTFDDIAVG